MNLRTILLGMLALIFSGSAALGVYLFVAKPTDTVETVSIVISAGQVPRGDASKLDLAHNKGTLRLSLRNPEDSLVDDIETATLLGMRGPSGVPFALQTDDPPAPEIPEPPPNLVRTREIVTPIRTVRGTSSGAVYVGQNLATPEPEAEVLAERAKQP